MEQSKQRAQEAPSYLERRKALRNREVVRVSKECAWRRRLVLVYELVTGDKESTHRLMVEMEKEQVDDMLLNLPSDQPHWDQTPHSRMGVLHSLFPQSSAEIELRQAQQKQYDSLRSVEKSLFEIQARSRALTIDAMDLWGVIPSRWKGRVPISEIQEKFRQIDSADVSELDGMTNKLPYRSEFL